MTPPLRRAKTTGRAACRAPGRCNATPASLAPMGKLSSLLRKLRPRNRDETDKVNDSAWDARTGSMVDGKGLSPTGAVMDFERDSERPK